MKHAYLKSTLALSGGCLILIGSTPAIAQFGGFSGIVSKQEKTDAGTAPIDKKTFDASANGVSDKVLKARITFLDSKVLLMEALGLKSEAVAKASEALRAAEGNTSDKISIAEKQTSVSQEASKQIEETMAKSEQLSAESKAKFAEGSAKFIEGILAEKDQIESIQKLTQQGQNLVQTAGLTEKLSVMSLVKPVTSMSLMVPGDVKEGSTTLSKILKFAKTQNVEIPDADKATAKLGLLED
jgi:hypothetical protein